MVWNYLFDETEFTFDDQLIEQIKQKKNSLVQSTLQNDETLCTAVDVFGNSLLHYAAAHINDGIIPYLIKSKANINLQDKSGNTPLLLATKNQDAESTKVLLKSDADIYICDKDGNNPLQWALKSFSEYGVIAKLFLHHISDDCSDSTEIAKKLMKIKCPLYVAVLLENVDVTTCVISEGCAIDEKDPKTGKTALHVAVDNVDPVHVEKLVFLGADVNVKDESGKMPLAMIRDCSGSSKILSILETLIDEKMNVTSCDNDGFMQVRFILKHGTAEAVKIVMESECDYSCETDEHEQTFVHYLAKNCNSGVAEVTDDVGDIEDFDLNARDKDGLTAMHYAMNSGNTKFVKLLIMSGANLNIANHDGVTPFLYCVDSTWEGTLKDRVECVKILLMNEAYPDIFLGHYFKIHDTKSMINRDCALLEPCVAMLALWKNLGKSFNKDILGKIEMHPKLKEYFDKCTEELEKMKSDVIYKSITVFDVLVENDNVQDSKYYFAITHESTGQLLEKYNHSDSIYYNILDNNLCDMLASPDDFLWAESLFLIKHYYVLIVTFAISMAIILLLLIGL